MRGYVGLVAWASVVFACGPAPPQPKPMAFPVSPTQPDQACPGRAVDDQQPLKYARTGTFCEGAYLENVSARPLIAVSLTSSFVDADLMSIVPMQLEWRAPINSSFHVLGRTIGAPHYALDAD